MSEISDLFVQYCDGSYPSEAFCVGWGVLVRMEGNRRCDRSVTEVEMPAKKDDFNFRELLRSRQPCRLFQD
jgi:hypothetical protein